MLMIPPRFLWAAGAVVGVLLGAFLTGARISIAPFSIGYSEPHGVLGFIHSGALHAASAIFIATLVFEAVERASHRRLEAATERLVDRAVQSVARRAAGELHPADVVEEAVKAIFSTTLVRENYLQEYIFHSFDRDKNIVRITERIEYTIKNTSSLETPFRPTLKYDKEDIFSDIPGFSKDRLSYVKIGERLFTEEEIAALNEASDKDDDVVTIGTFAIGPNAELRVRLELNAQIMSTYTKSSYLLIPTRGLTVIIDNRIGPQLRTEITGTMRNPFSPAESLNAEGSRREQRYDEIILPPGGWMVAWHVSEGMQSDAPPNEAD